MKTSAKHVGLADGP